MQLLAADVVLVGDGGGKAPAIRKPLYGADRVARYLTGLARWLRDGDLHLQPTEINGQPGAITFDAQGRIFNVISLDIAQGRVQTIRGIINPDKLRHLGTVSDVARLLLEARGEGGRD